MSCLVATQSMCDAAAAIVHACGETDFRAGVAHELLKLPLPHCWSHVTSWYGTLDAAAGEPQLLRVREREFLLLLAAAANLNLTGMLHPALRIVHELRIHAAAGCLDSWGPAAVGNRVCEVLPTADRVRFVLASLGVKASRKLYRRSTSQRSEFPGLEHELPPQLKTQSLLDAIEVLAGEQRCFAPTSAVGPWNLGWVAKESASVRKVNGLAAAAEALHWIQESYRIADEQPDDFLRAAARIEAAMCFEKGAAGLVGYASGAGPGQVRRNMRSSQPWPPPAGTTSLQVMGATDAVRRGVAAKETRRIEQGVHPATLEEGEMLLVEWWEVLELWNQAMVPFDALASWNHEHYVYGETTGWDIVCSALEHWLVTQKLCPGQYALASIEGFRSMYATRDHGHGNERECAGCGNKCAGSLGVPLQKCARCGMVWYCSTACQKKDWHAGHKAVCKRP